MGCEFLRDRGWDSYEERWCRRHLPSCRRCKLKDEANECRRAAAAIRVAFYEKLLPECDKLQRGIVYDLRIPDLLALQRDALLMLAEVCVPKDLALTAHCAAVWSSETSLRKWSRDLALVSTLGTTSQSFRCTKHILKHSTFITDNKRDVLLLLRGQPVNASPKWCVNGLTCVTTADERYVSLQPFIPAWEHNENMVITSKSEAHPALDLREFDAYGALRAGCGLQLPRLLAATEQRLLSFQRQSVVDILMALLWQVGPPSTAEIPLDELRARPTGGWLRHALQLLNDANFAECLCKQVQRLLKHSEDNWSNDKVLLCICYIARCIAEHSATGGRAKCMLEGSSLDNVTRHDNIVYFLPGYPRGRSLSHTGHV